MSKKFYFGSEDDTFCFPIKSILADAKAEGLQQVEVFEAVPDSHGDHIWCTHYGEVVERGECKKSQCEKYTSKTGKGVCSNRGKYHTFGDKKTFDVI